MKKQDFQLILILCLLLYILVVIRNAWTSDDAFITYRTVENFLSGYGLTYNPYVRVQSYTHPLWMFLLSASYYLFQQLHLTFGVGVYFPALFSSVSISALTVFWVTTKITRQDLTPLFLFFAPILLSRAYIDFSTSGLENPLTHFLLALFLWGLFREKYDYFFLALISALIGINRLDTLLLVIPSLCSVFWLERTNWKKNLIKLFLGFAPLFLWELFSLFYYGFPFPNTAYAKLSTGISRTLLAEQGLDYILNLLNSDPLTLFVIGFAGIGSILERNKNHISLFVGIILYFAYIISIGGDFMGGRFFSASLLIAAVILSQFKSFSQKFILLGLGAIVILGTFTVRSTLLDPQMPLGFSNFQVVDDNGIADERLGYFDRNRNQGLVILGFRDLPFSSTLYGPNWSYSGNFQIQVHSALFARRAYEKGPNFYCVDQSGLVDPLLARLPIMNRSQWRIGHFLRDIPQGYLETLKTGELAITNPDLAQYYQKLSLVITSPLWDSERIVEIWRFNTGQYDYLVQAYLSQ